MIRPDTFLLADLFGTSDARKAFDNTALIQGWLDAEAALALAQADHGVIPRDAADRIKQEAHAEFYDFDSIGAGIVESSHPLVPLIRLLVTRCGEEAGRWVHWGATTQDIMDTGAVLQVRRALRGIFSDLDNAVTASAGLAETYRDAVMAGRTHGQHAVPITFGFKAAIWTDELVRARSRLSSAQEEISVGQLGGAVGTLAAMGHRAPEVRATFCRRLGLHEPSINWQSSRDRIRDLVHALDQVGAAAERIAAEIVRLQSTETQELREPASSAHVGSSTMPQKRNPFTSEFVIASARLIHASAAAVFSSTIHAHERDMAAWAVEWIAVPQCVVLGAGIAQKLAVVLGGLEVDTARMAENIQIAGGEIMAEAAMMALAHEIGHQRAHEQLLELVRSSRSSNRSLRDTVRASMSGLDRDDMLAVFDAPDQHLGFTDETIDCACKLAAQLQSVHSNGKNSE